MQASSMKSSNKIIPEIAALDLEPIKRKFKMEANPGEPDLTSFAEREYRRFLTLIFVYPTERIVPNQLMDDFWHCHILDTHKYALDSRRVFGGFLNHNPYFGLGSAKSKRRLTDAFEKTKRLYAEQFGSDMTAPFEDAALLAKCGTCTACASSCAGRITA
jgi:hypothetical protein